jgi:hypothetical protein
MTNLKERFWSKVDMLSTPNGCWEWKGYRGKTEGPHQDGYGRITIGHKSIRAHRVAWELNHGCSIPSEILVCHKCDNPPCCRPDHLYLGTKSDNERDCLRAGRNNPSIGEKNGEAKLTEAQVIEIRGSNLSQRKLAVKYNVGRRTVVHVLRRETWKCV